MRRKTEDLEQALDDPNRYTHRVGPFEPLTICGLDDDATEFFLVRKTAKFPSRLTLGVMVSLPPPCRICWKLKRPRRTPKDAPK